MGIIIPNNTLFNFAHEVRVLLLFCNRVIARAALLDIPHVCEYNIRFFCFFT